MQTRPTGYIGVKVCMYMYVCIVRAGVQPTLEPHAEAFIGYSRPTALTQEGRSQVDDVCECMRD